LKIRFCLIDLINSLTPKKAIPPTINTFTANQSQSQILPKDVCTPKSDATPHIINVTIENSSNGIKRYEAIPIASGVPMIKTTSPQTIDPF